MRWLALGAALVLVLCSLVFLGGQSTNIVPSHGLVYVRIGKYTGARAGGQALGKMLPMLLEALPPVQ